jgi:diguanylate cyclase (GGDEF)-like protein
MGISVSFAMIDIDRFKSVNDTYGHLTGDRVIKSLARILQDRLRRSDIIGRYGGEEFGIILFNSDAHQAFLILDDIREAFSRIQQSDGPREFCTTFSCGIADFPRFASPLKMSEVADAALYAAKEGGRNQVMIAPGESVSDGVEER